MIIGSGDIAQALNDRNEFIFFASGVSNSSCTDKKEFQREIELLYKQDRSQHLVYFSTIQTDKRTPYTKHKLIMERYVSALFENFTVIRIGNIDWGTNPNTFLNYLRAEIKKGNQPEIRDELKFMISKNELNFITNNLPYKGRNTINVFGQMAKVKDLI